MYRSASLFPRTLSNKVGVAVRDAELSVLEDLASGKSVFEVLDNLVRMMEAQMDDSIGAVTLLDPNGKKFGGGAYPNLPESFAEQMDGLEIGPRGGSCGTAAFTQELTITEDIESDPRWEQYRDLALPLGLRACWSCPIIEAPNKVLGTFAFYYRTPKKPTGQELGLVEAASAIARIAIQMSRAQGTARLLTSAMSHLNDMVIITDADLADREGPRVIFVNESFERVTGFRRNAVIGRRPAFLEAMDGPIEALEKMQSTLRDQGATRAELILRKADGAPFWVEADLAPIHDGEGKLTHFVSIQRDITERKRTEEALRDRERSLDTLLSNLPGMAYRCRDGNDWTLEYASHGCRVLTGYDAAELIESRSARFIDVIDLEDQAIVRETIGMAIGRAEPYELSYRIRMKDGTVRWVWDRGQGVFAPDGALRFTEGFLTDITERKFLEEQVIQAQRLEGIGTLAGGIAHDLNNILAPILMTTDLLNDKIDDPEARSLLRAAAESASRGANLVKQILLFARGADGRRVSLSAIQVVEQLGQLLEDTLPKDIRIEIAIQPGLKGIRGDPAQLQQVMLNLCVNARDAMPTGGTLRIAATMLTVASSTARPHPDASPGEYVRIDFTDSGMGIADHHRSRVFDPFFTTKDIGKGKGLGLSTSRAIIKSHQGFVTLRSAPGLGSTFSIFLPVFSGAPTESVTQMPGNSEALPRGSGQRVLVVDDEDTVRLIARTTLERFGYHVTLACDGVQAAGILARAPNEIELAIVDVQMPGLDGSATIAALRNVRPFLPIISASGSQFPRLRRQLEVSGVRHFLDKPFSVETLVRTVHAALRPAAPGPR